MSAKEEIAEYGVKTRFGKRKKYKIDPKVEQPKTRGEAISQIEETISYNGWNDRDFTWNCESLGLSRKSLKQYSNDELKIIYDDFVRHKMILAK